MPDALVEHIFIKIILSDALVEHDDRVSIRGRHIINLRFAEDDDSLAEEQQELETLIESFDKTCTKY